ncbi:acyl-CoA thioesterase [Microaerobacter geothermalis]|nr:acyl-CoA thioesterase [Microaerobacter geothermalis]
MGVVYHSNYLIWFEVGRTELIRSVGLPYSLLEEKNLLLPAIEANCRYLSPARYDDELRIKTQIEEMTGVRIQFKYEIWRMIDQTLLVEGFTKHAWVNERMKPISLKSKFPEIYQLILSEAL